MIRKLRLRINVEEVHQGPFVRRFRRAWIGSRSPSPPPSTRRRTTVPRGYEISFFEVLPDVQAYTIKSIEADHLVLEGFSEINKTHIPLYSIKAIVRLKVPGK